MSSKLYSHPFVAEEFERSLPFVKAAAQHVGKNSHREQEAQAENRTKMTAAQMYDHLVMRRTLGLVNTLRVLDDARRMITVFPTDIGKGTNGVSRDRWVDYHYGYFTVSLASVPD